MKSCLSKAFLRRLAVALAILGTLTLSPDGRACPQDSPIQRSTDPFNPYVRVWDYRITNAPGTETQGYDPSGGKNASLALSINGIIGIAYERPDPENNEGSGNALSVQRFNVNFPMPGMCLCDLDDDCPLRLDDAPANGTEFSHVSLAIAREGQSSLFAGQVFATWLSKPPGQTPSRVMLPFAYDLRETPTPDTIYFSRAYFGPAPASAGGNDDFGPSAAIQPTRESVSLTSRLRSPAPDRRGLIHEIQASSTVTEDRFRCCDDGGSCSGAPLEFCTVQYQRWQPCAFTQRTTGLTAVVWAENERSNTLDPRYNIALRIYDSDGILLAQIDRDAPLHKSVNQPNLEIPDSDQVSPAAALDQCGNIVITWVGPDPLDTSVCGASPGGQRVYGRRLAFQNGVLFFRDNQFVADANEGEWVVGPDPDPVNPTVALH